MTNQTLIKNVTHYFFLQSVSSREYEAGEILFDHLSDNPNVNVIAYPPFKAKSLQDMERFVNNIIASVNANDKIVFYVDIHSNERTFTFKDVLSQNKADFTEYHPWECLNGMFNMLYEKYGRNILVIFISCFSTVYFSSLKSPHVHVIAAEGEVNPMRARQMLTILYDEFCKNENVEQAYYEMTRKFPIEEEQRKTDTYKAVLKLFK